MTMSAPRSRTKSTLPGADSGRDSCAEVLGELDRDRADTAGAGVDEDLLTGLQLAPLHERLPGRQSHQRKRRRFLEADRCRFERQVGLGDRDALAARRKRTGRKTRTALLADFHTHVSMRMRTLIAAGDWPPVVRQPAYAPDLTPPRASGRGCAARRWRRCEARPWRLVASPATRSAELPTWQDDTCPAASPDLHLLAIPQWTPC